MSDNEREKEYISNFTLEGILTHFTIIIKRQTRIIIALIVAIVLIVAGFLWYITLPVEETTTTTQTVDGIEASTINQIGGDSYGQSDTN